jgi:hypothetical protein
MLVDTYKTITVRRLMMTPTKSAKMRKVLALVMWYLPVIDRLKHMFSNPRDAELLLWNVNCKTDEKIQHHVDGR